MNKRYWVARAGAEDFMWLIPKEFSEEDLDANGHLRSDLRHEFDKEVIGFFEIELVEESEMTEEELAAIEKPD